MEPIFLNIKKMPRIGLEPTCREAPEPKSGVSAIPPPGQRSNLDKRNPFRQLVLVHFFGLCLK